MDQAFEVNGFFILAIVYSNDIWVRRSGVWQAISILGTIFNIGIPRVVTNDTQLRIVCPVIAMQG